MKKIKEFRVWSLGFSFFLSIFLYLSTAGPLSYAATQSQKTTTNRLDLDPSMSVRVTTYVGGYLFDLQGLTSPWAKVEFYSTEGNISVTTIADDQGEFHFQNVLAPFQTGDFCFLAYDTNNQANNPLCFSAPPRNTKTIIKDIVLSPSLSLEKGKLKQGEKSAAAGRTFPNAHVKVFLFEENRPILPSIFYLLSSKIFAREGPQLEVMSSPKGDFSFNLPTHRAGRWRIFVGPEYKQTNLTAKSNILEFTAISWWQWFLLTAVNWIYQLLTRLFKFLFDWKTLVILLTAGTAVLGYKIVDGR